MFGERLAEVRNDHGDTQQTLGEKLNVTKFTISNWEQEKSEPLHEFVVKICKLYNVSADYLLGVSDVDPVYAQRRRTSTFNKRELEELQQFESFLLWRRKKAQKAEKE